MEHTKAYQEFKKNGNTKFVRYSRWCRRCISMSVIKVSCKWLRMPRLVIRLVSLYLLIQKYWISILKLFILQILSFISR